MKKATAITCVLVDIGGVLLKGAAMVGQQGPSKSGKQRAL